MYNVKIKMSDGEYLLFHGYSGAVDIVDKEVMEIIESFGKEGDQSIPVIPVEDKVREYLLRRCYITEKSEEEEKAMVKKIVQAVNNAKKLPGFVIIPSYACNLRCIYCYQQKFIREKGINHIMDLSLVDKAFDVMLHLIEEYKGDSRHKISPDLLLYGGEPFTRRNYEVVSYIIKKGRAYGFTFSAITNGTQVDLFFPLFESPEIFTFFQITLDGPQRIHDMRRVYPGGRGSFEEITRNISSLLESGYKVSVRVNVNNDNLHYINELADFIEEKGWRKYENFEIYCANVITEERKGSIEEPLFSQKLGEALGRRYSYLTPWHGKIYNMFFRIFEAGGRVDFGSGFCSATTGQFIFDPMGDLYSCWDTVGFYESIGKIGRYYPEFELFEENLSQWRNRTVANIPQCLSCPYALLCKGGCPAYAYYNTGSTYSPYCSGFQALFEHQVRRAYKDFRIQQARQDAISQEGISVPAISDPSGPTSAVTEMSIRDKASCL
jgi:uncharacterized protein